MYVKNTCVANYLRSVAFYQFLSGPCFFRALGCFNLQITRGRRPSNAKPNLDPRVFAENEFGRVRFVVVCFLYKTNPNPRKIICCGKKWPKCHLLTQFFLGWVGLGLGSSSVS